MQTTELQNIRDKISEMHENDKKQLSVIFSTENRIMVEAPAGYGKTTTIISRLAYLIATNEIEYPKKILALTFSVNSALKMKREISNKLPEIIGVANNPNYVSKRSLITNYHGFCKFILKNYGYLLHNNLREIENLVAISDEELLRLPELSFLDEEKLVINSLIEMVINGEKLQDDLIQKYNDIIKTKILSSKRISHNAVITLTLEIFREFPEIQRFYTNYFRLIVIDEFQDTNSIAWKLVDSLISNYTKLLFVGDSLQKIYGFIGAYPNIMDICVRHYEMGKTYLQTNYRFRNNPEMLKLDHNLRKNAENFNSPNISNIANLPYFHADKQLAEAEWIANKVTELLDKDNSSRVAILVKGRGKNTEIIESQLQAENVDYFYALFKDDDIEYIKFHQKCLEIFLEYFKEGDVLTKQKFVIFTRKVKSYYKDSQSKIDKALLQLLFALVEKVYSDYKDLPPQDRRTLLIDIFENRQLKQAMEYVSSKVVFTTIHSAKGLEWDYVLIADVEKYSLPFFRNCCDYCQDSQYNIVEDGRCSISKEIDEEMKSKLLEQLCVFYVAITRARTQVFISSSNQRYNFSGREFNNTCLSCLPQLPGINLIEC